MVAYCSRCTDQDVATNYSDTKAEWTMRFRCVFWNSDEEQCEKCWQSCRMKGTAPHVRCIKWFGWGKSCQRRWYCPEHAWDTLGMADPVEKTTATSV